MDGASLAAKSQGHPVQPGNPARDQFRLVRFAHFLRVAGVERMHLAHSWINSAVLRWKARQPFGLEETPLVARL